MKTTSKSGTGRIKSILFVFPVIVLILPGLQEKFAFVREKKLTGAFALVKKPDLQAFTWKTWLNGTFQDTLNEEIEQHIGFRNSLVRLNNQIDFSLFKQANAEGVVVCRNNELMEKDYILEYKGDYFIGDSVWKAKASRLKKVQDTLARLGKTLVVILEPGKAGFYPELIPRQFIRKSANPSNYDVCRNYLSRSGINLLDLNRYFLTLKGKTAFPVFPQCGTHWSYFGAALAADTSLKFLRQLTGRNIPEMQIVRNEVLDTTRHPDYDIGLAMNLIFTIPHPETANPVIEFKSTANTERPKVLIAGDSFYFNWLNMLIPARAFSSCDFWYYNKNITHSDGTGGGSVQDLNFGEEIQKRDIIVLMITGRFMHSFAWGFDEQLFKLFYPGELNPVEHFENNIRAYGPEFQRMYSEASAMNISLAERIHREASYLLYADSKNNPDKYATKEQRMQIIEAGIRGTPEWMKKIEQKAKTNNISVDEQVYKDAEWIYHEKYENNK